MVQHWGVQVGRRGPLNRRRGARLSGTPLFYSSPFVAGLQIDHTGGEKGLSMATVRGRVLLGWLSRDQAVLFLLNECVFDPPIDAAAAESIWRPFHDRALAIPERPPVLLPRLPLTVSEIAHAKQFMAFLNRTLGAHDITADRDWLRECLPTVVKPSPIRINPVRQPHPFSTGADIDIPHGEFFFAPDKKGAWTVSELRRHVTAIEFSGRTFLKGGYHRSFAKVSAAPTATVPAAVVALASNATVVLPVPTQPAVSAALTTGTADLSPFGRRAAILRDFFTDGFFMDVNLRKKRYQLQVRSTWIPVDDV